MILSYLSSGLLNHKCVQLFQSFVQHRNISFSDRRQYTSCLRSFVVLVYVCVCTDQVLDDLLYLGLSLLHLLRRPFETDALLAIGKLYVNLHTQTGIKASQLWSSPFCSVLCWFFHAVIHLSWCQVSKIKCPPQPLFFVCVLSSIFCFTGPILHNNCCRNTASSPQSFLSHAAGAGCETSVLSPAFYLRSPHAFFVLLSLPVVAAVWSARCSVLSCQWWSGAARRGQSPPPPLRS